MDPVQKPRVGPKDFFLWLGAMAFLYASVISLLALVFSYIDVLFPNTLEYYNDYSSGIRFSIAALIVVFPIYVFLTRVLHQDLRRNPEKKDLWVRKWLIFLTLFVAGITIAIDLVALINTYLQGEITMRFAWKALSILVVVGAGFAYYAYELKGTWEAKKRESQLIAGAVSLIVLGAIVGGFFIVGSPETQRMLRLDQQRINDLSNIQANVITYWQQKQKLPADLAALEDPLTGFTQPKDPETGMAYSYRPTDKLAFELCATFDLASSLSAQAGGSTNTDMRAPAPVTTPVKSPYYSPYGETWDHAAGQACFTRTIDPDKFPPFNK